MVGQHVNLVAGFQHKIFTFIRKYPRRGLSAAAALPVRWPCYSILLCDGKFRDVFPPNRPGKTPPRFRWKRSRSPECSRWCRRRDDHSALAALAPSRSSRSLIIVIARILGLSCFATMILSMFIAVVIISRHQRTGAFNTDFFQGVINRLSARTSP